MLQQPAALLLVCLSALAFCGRTTAAQPPRQDPSALTREQAGAIVSRAGGTLVLDRLATVSPAVAVELARHGGGLSLDGLTALDVAAARALALHGRLPPEAPEDLDVDALLEKVAALAGAADGPDFEGIDRLLSGFGPGNGAESAGAAGAGGPRGDDAWLSLGGLRAIDAGVAAALALHDGPLLLDGLSSLSVEAAGALALHVGELSLAGLEALPAAVRAALAEHDGPVVLPDKLLGK